MPDTLFSEDFEIRKKESVKPDYLVYKTNPLLMVRDEMAIMQARFFTAYLCKVDPENPDTYKARFSLSAFCKMLDVDASNIKKLKEDCRTIRKMGFDFIEYRRKHGEKIDPMLMDEVSLFSRFTISGNTNDGYFVEVTPTEEMKHLLLNQRKYGFVSYEAKNTLVLSSKRYMRMYEFLKRSEGKGITVDINTLKAYLGLSEEDYPEVKILRRNIINKALKEINEKTDITVTCEPKKKGRGGKIVGFHFTVKKDKAALPETESVAEEEKPFILSDEDIEEFNSSEEAEAPASDRLGEEEHDTTDKRLLNVIPEECQSKLPTIRQLVVDCLKGGNKIIFNIEERDNILCDILHKFNAVYKTAQAEGLINKSAGGWYVTVLEKHIENGKFNMIINEPTSPNEKEVSFDVELAERQAREHRIDFGTKKNKRRKE